MHNSARIENRGQEQNAEDSPSWSVEEADRRIRSRGASAFGTYSRICCHVSASHRVLRMERRSREGDAEPGVLPGCVLGVHEDPPFRRVVYALQPPRSDPPASDGAGAAFSLMTLLHGARGDILPCSEKDETASPRSAMRFQRFPACIKS